MSIANFIRDRSSTLDSLDIVDKEKEASIMALEAIKAKEVKVDSLKGEIEKNKIDIIIYTICKTNFSQTRFLGLSWVGCLLFLRPKTIPLVFLVQSPLLGCRL